MSGAKRILPLLAALCFALFLLYGVYFNAFGANAESMMAFFDITESRQGFVMTIQSLGGIVMTVLLGLFGERLHKLYGLLAGAVLVGVAGVTIGTMPLYGNDSYGLLLVFALIGGVGYITIDLLMNGVIADVSGLVGVKDPPTLQDLIAGIDLRGWLTQTAMLEQ